MTSTRLTASTDASYQPPARWGLPAPGTASQAMPKLKWTSQTVLIPVVATLLRIASNPTATLGYFLIAAYALMGRPQAIISLFLCCIFNLLSHGFPAGPPQSAAILRFLVFFAAAFSVFSRGHSANSPSERSLLLPATIAMCGLIACHSLVASSMIDVSLLKVFSFTLVVTTIFAGWSWMPLAERQLVQKIIIGGLMLTAIASIPLLRRPMGYMMNPSLFQGVMVHPNNFGPSMAILSAITGMQCLVWRPLKPWRIAMFVVAFVMMYLSRSRMSLFAFVGGVALGIAAEALRSILASYRKSPSVVGSRIAVGGISAAVLSIIFAGQLTAAYKQFLTKGRSDVATVTEAFQQTRGFLIDAMWANIHRHPLTGIGFGVGSNPEAWVGLVRDPIFGLPLMYTIEKGVMPIAVIEEMGYPVAFFVFLWLAMLIVRSARGGIVPLVAASTAILTNLAESTLFSPGGMGLLVLLVVGWAVTEPPGGSWLPITRRGQPRPAEA